MFNLYDNIKSLCALHGTTPSRLCEEVGVSKTALSNLKNGRAATLSVSTCEKIADHLGEPLDRVMHGDTTDDSERRLLEQLRSSGATRALLHSLRDMSEEEILAYADFVRSLRNAN